MRPSVLMTWSALTQTPSVGAVPSTSSPEAFLVRQERPMMHVWSHRPQILYLGFFVAAYVLGCGFAQALAIVPGITVSIWPPAGVFIATLVLTSRYSWPWWILAGCLAEMFAQLVWYHSPLPAGLLIYAGNALVRCCRCHARETHMWARGSARNLAGSSCICRTGCRSCARSQARRSEVRHLRGLA